MSSIPGLPTRGTDVTVHITRVHLHPLCTFVEFWGKFDQDSTAEYECLAKDIQSPGYTFQEFEGNPCDQCLVHINGTWYRSRIVSRNGSKYNVYLFDKGISFSTTSSKLAWGKKEHFQLPPEVEFCVLANVLPLSQNNWSPVFLEYLKSLCGKSVKANVQDILVHHRLFLLHIPCIFKQMYEMGFVKKLSPDIFQDIVLLSLQCRSGAETQLTSTEAVEPLNRQEVFMYPELSVETVVTVIVTEVSSPQKIFCQLKVFSHELKKLSERLRQYCESRKESCILNPEMIGFPCAARGSDDRWYRSVIQQLFLTNKMVEVLNVDYGTKQLVQVENVRPLAAEFFRMPVVTYICSLHGITDKGLGWTASHIDFLRSLLLHKTVIAKFEYQSISEGVHYVTLYGDENTNINNLFGSKENCLLECEKTLKEYAILSSTHSRCHPVQQENPPAMMPPAAKATEEKDRAVAELLPAEKLTLNSSHVVVVQHVSTPSEFWIQTQNNAKEWNNLTDGMYHFYKNLGDKDVVKSPTVGLYCAAKAEDGDFYRAVVSEVGKTQIKMFFVDYGSSEVVDRINVRILADKFKTLPVLALKCSLAGIRPKDGRWSQKASEFFIKAVTGKVLNVHVTATHYDGYVVQLTDPEAQSEKDVSALMCSCNLAEKADIQRPTKAKMQHALLPHTQYTDSRFLGVYKNNGTPFQNTVGLAKNVKRIPTFDEHMFPTGSVLDVCVSYIESPNDFWCQLVQHAGHLKLLMHDIQAYYTGSEFEPFVETACVARHPDNTMWYRALVIHKHETPHVDVLFVDYGQTETVSLYDLRRIRPEFLTLQGQAFRCSLLNPVDPTSVINSWNDEAIAKFHSFVETAASNLVILKCTIYAVMYSEQKIVFNIVDLETPFESICTTMVNLVKNAPPKKASVSLCHLDTYYYSTHNIKTGTEEQVTVTCVNTVGQFYCQLQRNVDVIKDLKIKVNSLCHQLENVKVPAVFGTLCFAKYTDGHWYRGQIKSTKPEILVHFVDYGDTIEVDKSKLLPVPREANDIMSVPVQAVLCSLSDLPTDVPSEANSWFETSATDCKFRALVVAREPDGKLLVELYHGNTQINAKIKKMFQIALQTEDLVVCQNWKPPTTPAKYVQKPGPKQATEMDNHTQTLKSSLTAPKPEHQMMSDESTLTDMKIQTASKISHQKVKAAPLELYRPPHQRKSCDMTPENTGNGFEPTGSHVESTKENIPTDTKQMAKSRLPGTETQKENKVEKLPQVADLPSKSITIGMEADVYVSHCNSPLSFYVTLVGEENEIFSIGEMLNDPKSTLKTSDIKDLKPGDLVQAEFADDSSWYRAVVREMHTNTIALVEFVDFGNTAMIPVSKIGRLHKSFLEFPVYSTHCMLNSALSFGKEEVSDLEVVSAFKEDISGNGEKVLKCRFIRKSGSVWEVSLEDSGVTVLCKVPTECSTNESKLTSEEIDQAEVKPAQNLEPENKEKCSLNPCSLHFHQQQFLEGQQLEVYIATINDAQTMWCQLADSEELEKITLKVSEVAAAADQKCIDPKCLSLGSSCIALFSDDSLWYRAEVVCINADNLSVRFVDYGNVSQVCITDVRAMPPDLVEVPSQAFLCELEGFDFSNGSWDSGAVDELSALTTDKLIQLTVLRLEREKEKVKFFVRMECGGQTINEVMKSWWKSSTAETNPDEVGVSASYEQPQQFDLADKDVARSEVHPEPPENQDTNNALACIHLQRGNSEEQFADELAELHTASEAAAASSPKTSETDVEPFAECPEEERDEKSSECDRTLDVSVVAYTEPEDILPCDSGIEETVSSPLDEKDDENVLTLICGENPGETNKGPETEGSSPMNTSVADDVTSSLYENLEEAPDRTEIPTTDLEHLVEDVDTGMESGFDHRISTGK